MVTYCQCPEFIEDPDDGMCRQCGCPPKPERPNCYECKWRGTLPGTHHSKCVHPSAVKAIAESENQPLYELMAILAGVGRVPPVLMDAGLNVVGSEHGIGKGWFNWPFNFDPIWLESCDGFESNEGEA